MGVDTSSVRSTTIYVEGRNKGNEANSFPLKIVVCGKLSLTVSSFSLTLTVD